MHIVLIAGDTGSKIVVTCKDKDTAVVIDLTGATAKLRYSINGGATVEKNMVIVAPATAGKVEYQFLSADLVAGTMQSEVQITDAGGKIITSLEPFTLSIRGKI